jgi:hypothetical protein
MPSELAGAARASARFPVGAVADWMVAQRPLPLLLTLSALIGLAGCLAQFDGGFLRGSAAFWRNPPGLDTAAALAGYEFFVRDAWRLPLFHVAQLGPPHGAELIFTDSVPLLALIGRLIVRAGGGAVNLYGAWTVLCVAASGVSMSLLVAVLGARSLLAMLAATAIGLAMPALLARWGHLALMAQFEVVLALALCLASRRSARPLALLRWAHPLGLLALWTHPYLLAMVGALALAGFGQAACDRRARPAAAARGAAALAAALAGIAALSGYFPGPSALGAFGYGYFSANLASLLTPQKSGLLAALGVRAGYVDATGGQYEGFCYLGAGVLLLLWAGRRSWLPRLRGAWRRHGCLLIVLGACSAFAVSHRVYLGGLHLLDAPVPAAVLALAAPFRAGGRFIWPAMYLAAAAAIAAGAALPARRQVPLLLAAAALQWWDVAPLRADLLGNIAVLPSAPVDPAAWRAALPRHGFLRVQPPFGCGEADARTGRILAALALLAARANAPTNSFRAARGRPDCREPQAGGRSDELAVYLPGSRGFVAQRPAEDCTAGAGMVVCSGRLPAPARLLLMPRPAAPASSPRARARVITTPPDRRRRRPWSPSCPPTNRSANAATARLPASIGRISSRATCSSTGPAARYSTSTTSGSRC